MNERGQRPRLLLEDAYKGYTLDQDKLLSPKDTIARFHERLKHLDLDIFQGAVRIDRGRLDIPVYFSLCGRDAERIMGTRKQMGKGGTPEQAEASAIMELAERFSFFSFAQDPGNFREGTVAEVGGPVLSFDAIALSVHDEGADLDRARECFSKLPMRWVWGYSLTRDEPVLIPFDWFFAINEFNGPSAGNCREEAILQGICEVVERHVSALVSGQRLSCPALDLETTGDPLALALIRKYEGQGIRLFATDFSLNVGIPTVGVLAYDPSTFPERSEIVWTAGTTPGPDKALSRALTEVAQLAGDFDTRSQYVASGLPKVKSLEEATFVTGARQRTPLTALPDLSDDNIRVEVQNCVRALSRGGLEVLEIEVTHPVLGIPAFYTIVPGAHFRERAMGTSVGMFVAKLIAKRGDPLWAIEALKEMDRHLPGRYYSQFFLGEAHLALGRVLEAERYFEAARDLQPPQEEAVSIDVYLAVCLKEREEYRKALTVLERAEVLDPERTDIPNLMGFCYYRLKEHRRAVACFQKTLRLNPASAIDHANLASNYRELGERDRAVAEYRLALELDPDLAFAREALERLTAS